MRIAHAKEGSEQAERLQTLDPERRLYRYTMEETSMSRTVESVRHFLHAGTEGLRHRFREAL